MSVILEELGKCEIDEKTMHSIAFAVTKLANLPATTKSAWARAYADEVGICSELGLISLRSDFHEMHRDSKVKIVSEFEKIDFSMGSWNVTPKGLRVLNEIKTRFGKTLNWLEEFERDIQNPKDHYLPSNWQ